MLPSGAHAGLPPSVAYAGLPSGADAGLPSRANAGLSSSVANVGLPSGVHAGLSTSVAHSGFVSFDTHSGLSPSNADLGLTPSVTHSQLTTDGHCGLTPSVTHSKLTSSDAHSILYSGFTHSEAHSRPGLSGAHDRISDAKTRCAPGDHAGIPHSDVNVGTLNNCSNTQLSASAHDSFLHTSVHSGLSPTHANLSASNDYPQLSPSGANDGCAALSSAGIPASSAVHGALPPSSVSSRISTFVSPDRFLQTSVDTSLPHSDAHLEIPPSGVCSKPSLGTHTNILPSDAHASFAVNSAPQPSSHHSDPSHIPTALELDSPTGSGMPSNDDEMDYHPYSTSSLPYIAEPYHSVSLSSTTPSQTRTSPAYNTPPNSSSLGQSPTSPVIEISGPDSMASVPPHCSVRISAHCISKYLADDDHVGHLAWGLIKDMYFNSELIGRTLNGTSRGEAISPRRKNAVLKAIEDQLEGSKAKDAYRRTAHQAIVSGLRNISRSRGKLPANLSLKFF